MVSQKVKGRHSQDDEARDSQHDGLSSAEYLLPTTLYARRAFSHRQSTDQWTFNYCLSRHVVHLCATNLRIGN
jgi:hypothetical protein